MSSSSSSSSSQRDDSPKPKVVFEVEGDSDEAAPKKSEKKRDAKQKSKNGFKARIVKGDAESYRNFLNVNI